MSTNETMTKVTSFVGHYMRGKLVYYSHLYKLPISRIIAIAIDNELAREKPFELDTKMPTDDFVEHAYIDQAGALLDFMKGREGFSIDQLLILRNDIGIPDKSVLLLALRECLAKEFVEEFKPTRHRFGTPSEDRATYYRLKTEAPIEKKRVRKKATRFERYQKLKAEFKNEV